LPHNSTNTPYPRTLDGSLPNEYQNVFDPLETLTFIARNRHDYIRNIRNICNQYANSSSCKTCEKICYTWYHLPERMAITGTRISLSGQKVNIKLLMFPCSC